MAMAEMNGGILLDKPHCVTFCREEEKGKEDSGAQIGTNVYIKISKNAWGLWYK
jgi:Fe-S cluster biosynthesis and repair protein YggX